MFIIDDSTYIIYRPLTLRTVIGECVSLVKYFSAKPFKGMWIGYIFMMLLASLTMQSNIPSCYISLFLSMLCEETCHIR